MRSLFPALALLALVSGVARADENLVEKREHCQMQSRQHIKPKGRVTAELSKALLAKRQDYVRNCMEGKLAKPRSKGA